MAEEQDLDDFAGLPEEEDILDDDELEDSDAGEGLEEDIFGADGDEDEAGGGGGDDDEEAPAQRRAPSKRQAANAKQQAAEAAGAAEPLDRRAAMLALAAKKKREAEEEALGKEFVKNKKQRLEGGRRGGGAAPGGEEEGGEGSQRRRLKQSKAADLPAGEVPEFIDETETAADRDFIDDDGMDDGSAEGGDEEPGLAALYADDGPDGIFGAAEAEEVPEGMEGDEGGLEGEEEPLDEVDAILKARKRRNREDERDADITKTVDHLLVEMEVAADTDAEDLRRKRPALHKLRCLKRVEEVLLQRKYHESFLAYGGLNALNKWLRPYENGTLPSLNVRTTCLGLLEKLPIDTANEHVRGLLAKSELGKTVLFMSRNPGETAPNARLAGRIVAAWSKPIFYDEEREAEKRALKEERLRAQREADARRRAEAEKEVAVRKAVQATLRPGDAGYRMHASMPPSAKLDYAVNPSAQGRVGMEMGGGGEMPSASPAKPQDKLAQRFGKKSSKGGRAAKVDVEGRSLAA